MIDLHSHIMPEIDDGSQDIYDSIEMAEIAEDSGVEVIVATPHSNFKGVYENYYDHHFKQRFTHLKQALKDNNLSLTLIEGMEIMASDDIFQKLNSHPLITLNHTDVPLVEFDFFVHFDYIHYIVEQLLKNGYRPLIAHPERYFCIIKDPDRVRTLLKMGALIQCNKSSILGHFGLNIKTCVDYLLKEKLVTVVASDSHGIDVRTPDMSEIQFYLDLKYGSKMAELLLESNPKKILKL